MGKPWEILVGDIRRLLREMEPESFDAVLSDPPYGLAFMGARWDYSVPSVNVFTEILRVLKPGAHAMYFGGTRTFHRMMVNIEDAGFIPVDLCMWLYGTGFSKSIDIGKHIDRKKDTRTDVLVVTSWIGETAKRKGISGARINDHFGMVGMASHWMTGKSQPLVPTAEQWPKLLKLLGEKPPPDVLAVAKKVIREKGQPGDAWYAREKVGEEEAVSGSYAPGERASVRTRDITLAAGDESRRWSGYGNLLKPAWEPCGLFCKLHEGTIAENCVKHGTGGLDIDGTRVSTKARSFVDTRVDKVQQNAFGKYKPSNYDGSKGRCPANLVLDEEAGALLDQQSGNRPGMSGGGKHRPDYAGGMFGGKDDESSARGDQGGASRFFYTTKVGREERDRGLEGFEEVPKGVGALRDGKRAGTAKNAHPTLKPIDLCRYYARMLLPPPRADGKPRRLLVPYSGAGSEMIGALQAGWDEVVGVELVPKHAEWARARIARGKIIRNAKR